MVTATDVLTAIRKREPLCERVDVQQPVTLKEVLATFEAKTRARADLGARNRALNLLFESRNPFEPARRRKVKIEVGILGALVLLIVCALLLFNLAAPKVPLPRKAGAVGVPIPLESIGDPRVAR